MVLYDCAPHSAIIALVEVLAIYKGDRESVWRETGYGGGITRDEGGPGGDGEVDGHGGEKLLPSGGVGGQYYLFTSKVHIPKTFSEYS